MRMTRAPRLLLATAATALLSMALTVGAAVGPGTAQAFASGASSNSCTRSKATIERLRTLSIDDLSRVFSTLPAEAPIPNGAASGYAWFDSAQSTVTTQNQIHQLWQGKTFHNYPLIGHTVYDIVLGQEVFPGTVHTGTSRIDGRRVLVLDWTAYTPFYDEVRMIEPGIYIGHSFIQNTVLGTVLSPVLRAALSVPGVDIRSQVKPNVPVLNFILDMNCPNTYWNS